MNADNNNHHLLKYFPNVAEIATVINRSKNYVYDRLNQKDGKDFSLNDWELINRYIDQYKDVKNKHNKEIEKKISQHFSELAELFNQLSEE